MNNVIAMTVFSKVYADLGADVATLIPGELVESKVTSFSHYLKSTDLSYLVDRIHFGVSDNNITLSGSWQDLAVLRTFLKEWVQSTTGHLKTLGTDTEKHWDQPIKILELKEEPGNGELDSEKQPHEEVSASVTQSSDLTTDPEDPGLSSTVNFPSLEVCDKYCHQLHVAEQLSSVESQESKHDTSIPTEQYKLNYRKRRKAKYPAKCLYNNDETSELANRRCNEDMVPHTGSDSQHDNVLFQASRMRVSRRSKRAKPDPSSKLDDTTAIETEGKIPKKRGRPRLYPPGFHKPKKSYPPKYEECTCPECDFATTNRKNLAEHIKGNHKEKVYSCHLCTKRFSTRNRLNMHVNYHTSRGTFQCDICGRSLSSKTALDIHAHKKHDGPRPRCLPKEVLCTDCGKFCSNAAEYEVHINKEHKQITPYVCDICGKSYHGKIGLQSHQREVHNTEYKLQCTTCGKRFKRQNNLDIHKVVHAEERPFKCLICGKGFTQNGALSRHMRTHTGERPFKCYLCGSQSNAYSILRRHLQGVHKILEPSAIRQEIKKCKELGREEKLGLAGNTAEQYMEAPPFSTSEITSRTSAPSSSTLQTKLNSSQNAIVSTDINEVSNAECLNSHQYGGLHQGFTS